MKPTDELYKRLAKNLPLHAILEEMTQKLEYGQISVNVILKGGVADLKTLNIVLNRRRRY